MNMRNFSLGLLPVLMVAILSGCGQSGDLYLSDDLRAEQLEQQAATASISRSQQLRQQATHLRQRHQEMNSLRAQLAQLEQKEELLRGGGNIDEADKVLKEVNGTRYRIGKLLLEQQSSR